MQMIESEHEYRWKQLIMIKLITENMALIKAHERKNEEHNRQIRIYEKWVKKFQMHGKVSLTLFSQIFHMPENHRRTQRLTTLIDRSLSQRNYEGEKLVKMVQKCKTKQKIVHRMGDEMREYIRLRLLGPQARAA